jgi:hypothetical protein
MKESLRNHAYQFYEDFAREFSILPFIFSVSSAKIAERDWSVFTAEYRFWQENTKYQGLVRRVVLVAADGTGTVSFFSYDPDREFSSRRRCDVHGHGRSLRHRRSESLDRLRDPGRQEPDLESALVVQATGERVSVSKEGLVISRWDSRDFVCVILDPEYLVSTMIPNFVSEYFSSSTFLSDYRISVLSGERGYPLHHGRFRRQEARSRHSPPFGRGLGREGGRVRVRVLFERVPGRAQLAGGHELAHSEDEAAIP